MMISKRHMFQALKASALVFAGMAAVGLAAMYASGTKLLSVQSGSMAPAINKGDLVSVKSVPFDELSEGDVITFVSPEANATITHRVVALLPEDTAGNNVVTKGDANTVEDQPIEASSVVGRVDRSIPYLGYGLNFLRTWPGLILLIYIPALIIMIHETRRLAAHYRGMHYVLPEWLASRRPRTGHMGRNMAIILTAGLVSLAIAMPVRAALIQTAQLTGNTISIADIPEPKPKVKNTADKKPENNRKHTEVSGQQKQTQPEKAEEQRVEEERFRRMGNWPKIPEHERNMRRL